MATDVRRTDTMFIAPQRSCSGLQWSKTKWCIYIYSNCRKWPQVLQEYDIITFGWFNCWRQHLLSGTVLYHTSRHVISQMEIDFVIVSILCRRILTAEKPHRSCKNTVLQKIQHSSHILLIGVLLKSLTSSMVKIALRKLFAGILFCAVVWCCWCWLRSEWGKKKTIQTYPYSNCTFHHQNSQRKQTSFTVPTDLGKTLANIICCMCIFQHVGKQDRNHARTNMVKIALRKLFAGILCGCVVLLVGYEVSDEKKTSKPIHILTALFTTRIHKENKQILPYQPTSGKLWPT